jgi:hypothetical protein
LYLVFSQDSEYKYIVSFFEAFLRLFESSWIYIAAVNPRPTGAIRMFFFG